MALNLSTVKSLLSRALGVAVAVQAILSTVLAAAQSLNVPAGDQAIITLSASALATIVSALQQLLSIKIAAIKAARAAKAAK